MAATPNRRTVSLVALAIVLAACGPCVTPRSGPPPPADDRRPVATHDPAAVDAWLLVRGTPTPASNPPPDPAMGQSGRPGVKVALVWETDDGETRLDRPAALALGRRGEVYVVDAGHARLTVFGRDGRFRRAWGGPGGDAGQFNFVSTRHCPGDHPGGCAPEAGGGVAVDAQDRVYVADSGNHRVQVFDADGYFLAGWGREGGRPGEFRLPGGIAVDGQGRVYVGDSLNRRIQQFDGDGRFLAAWGSAPGGLAVDARGRVYVGDPRLGRVQVFDGPGRFQALLAWGGARPGAEPDAAGIAVDRAGRVYVVGAGGAVQQLDGEGRPLASWDADSWGKGRLARPAGVAVDGDGDVFVADAGGDRVVRFRVLTPVTR